MPVDLEQISRGHPALLSGGYLPIKEAANASGFDIEALLREATKGQVNLYFHAVTLWGYEVAFEDLMPDSSLPGGGVEVPPIDVRPDSAIVRDYSGMLRVRPASLASVAAELIDRGDVAVMLLMMVDRPSIAFAPDPPIVLTTGNVQVGVSEVEALRLRWAARVPVATPSPAPLIPATSVAIPRRPARRLSDAINAYMPVRSLTCNAEQARRVRMALDGFAELEGDPLLGDIDSHRLERFRDSTLPTVPADENKVRLKMGSTNLVESIRVVEGTKWPRLSLGEQSKRLKWIAAMFKWLKAKDWIAVDPAALLVQESKAIADLRKEKGRDQDARELFSRADLQRIFTGGKWFSAGRGELTKSGTYREFCPYYFWLPLLGLYTGARITELSQLSLTDIQRTEAGTWFLNIASLDDGEGLKRRKNANSKRSVPIHQALIALGLIDWCKELKRAGHVRLFPELKHDHVKGFGKASSKWFSAYMARLGWPRDGRKTFHSFRATLASECMNQLKLSEHLTSQISGHARSSSVLMTTYVKDVVPDELSSIVDRLDYGLPAIARFDVAAGLCALNDAIKRKAVGRSV